MSNRKHQPMPPSQMPQSKPEQPLIILIIYQIPQSQNPRPRTPPHFRIPVHRINRQLKPTYRTRITL
ncbi:hypothetical protein Hanom_Chr01g00057131 [Helianthus anomalus]